MISVINTKKANAKKNMTLLKNFNLAHKNQIQFVTILRMSVKILKLVYVSFNISRIKSASFQLKSVNMKKSKKALVNIIMNLLHKKTFAVILNKNA